MPFWASASPAAGVTLSRGVAAVEARGAAQTWQAAGTWAQVGAVWQGSATEVDFESGHLAVRSDVGTSGGDLGGAAPAASAIANVVRWQQGQGVVVRFLAGIGLSKFGRFSLLSRPRVVTTASPSVWRAG